MDRDKRGRCSLEALNIWPDVIKTKLKSWKIPHLIELLFSTNETKFNYATTLHVIWKFLQLYFTNVFLGARFDLVLGSIGLHGLAKICAEVPLQWEGCRFDSRPLLSHPEDTHAKLVLNSRLCGGGDRCFSQCVGTAVNQRQWTGLTPPTPRI